MQVDQDCFVRGEEDLFDTDTTFPLRPSHASLPVMRPGTSQVLASSGVSASAVASSPAVPGGGSANAPPASAALAAGSREASVKLGAEEGPAEPLRGASGPLGSPAAALDAAEAPSATGVVPPESDAQPPRVQTWLDPVYYSSPGAQPFKVRGKNYLSDRYAPRSLPLGIHLGVMHVHLAPAYLCYPSCISNSTCCACPRGVCQLRGRALLLVRRSPESESAVCTAAGGPVVACMSFPGSTKAP